MATVTVTKPKPTLVPASSVKGYRPEFVGDPGRANPVTDPAFVIKTGSRHGNYTTTTPTKAPGGTLKEHTRQRPDPIPVGRGKITPGRADSRQILGVGRTIVPHNGISLANVNGPGI